VVCNKDDEEVKKLVSKTIEVPHQVDCLQGILTIIPMQLLSLHIAELRNCDVSVDLMLCVVLYCRVTFINAADFVRLRACICIDRV